MRFHRLSISAFGPFPATETVDFDALSADGLFLLRGPTGAGKTSVLDALTFALYGNVPGERSPDRLKSQHAEPHRAPVVELDFSCGEDRYLVRRQASYYRPAKRAGAKPQREGTSLTIHRWSAGQWQPVPTARVVEGDVELENIIGLKMHEFTKVILLPQGAFAQLLHASNEQRRGILEQLFDISAYERLETHLWEQMRASEGALNQLDSQITLHADAVRRAAAALLGDQPDLSEVETSELAEAARAAAEAQHQVLAQAEAQARRAMEEAAKHAEDLAEARRQLTCWEQHRKRRAELQEDKAEAEEARRRLAEHQTASGIREWLRTAEEAAESHEAAAHRADEAAAQARQALKSQDDVDHRDLVADSGVQAEQIQEALSDLLTLQARLTGEEAADAQRRHQQLHTQAQQARQEAEEAQQQYDRLQKRVAEQLDEQQQAQEQLCDLTELDRRRDAAHAALTEAQRRTEQIAERDRLARTRADLAERAETRRAELDAAEAHYRSTAEAYLRSQAHELAAALQPGEPCLVCGSTEHPAPLTAAEDTVTREQADQASAELQEARARWEQVRAELSSTTEALEAVRTELGQHSESTADQAAQLAEAAQAETQRADTAREDQHRLRESLEKLTTAVADTRHQLSSAAHRIEQQQETAQRLAEEAIQQQAVLDQLRGDHPSLEARLEALSELKQKLQTAQQAAEEAERAQQEARRSQTAAAAQLEKSPFDHADQVQQALCADEQLQQLRSTVEAFDTRARQLDYEAELAEVRAGRRRAEAGESAPEEETVQQAQQRAAETAEDCQQHHQRLTAFTARRESLTDAADALDQALRRRTEEATEHLRTAELAQVLNGKGDNALRMRLTTYVLAARLERIADAATRHLKAMSDGRYQLLLDAERSGKGLRGLDLKVYDEYAEQQRPAETLSGGETFMTSLSMALGLAEVVQSEAGGIGMESLFIDEGFGSLDEQTLEAVMTALETLRGEGRRIGVVSHVTEMHQQIPMQLRVEKTRSGSRLRMQEPV
ncbi:SMC family ATPase [Nesterenkonia sp.]|uniref:AAA family ATPase n=1 Tax=Nesterenkonia sp. TaxID=704201 RepID=UPI00260858D9|nr:SMC family ATPase [Nesterenkonia sp.]